MRAALADASRKGLSHLLIFDDQTGRQTDFAAGSAPESELASETPAPTPAPASTPAATTASSPVPAPAPAAVRRPGRPSLGVVAREVTLLPQHWEWLANQPGGASVTLRKLVTQAKKDSTSKDRARAAIDATYQFLHAIGGNLPEYEEVTRALFAGDFARMANFMKDWPADVRDYALVLTGPASS